MKMFRAALTRYLPGVIGAAFTLLTGLPANSAPVPGGTLDPLTIPKYVQPLVIPPVMPKSTSVSTPTADYDIAVRQFQQQILPGGVWNVLNGRTDGFPATTIWSYGRAEDPLPDVTLAVPGKGLTAGVAPAPNSTFNYPAFTLENSSGVATSVRWINDLVDPLTGNYRPHLFPVDQTLHWANPPKANCIDMMAGMVIPNLTDCHTDVPTPYTGPVPLVTHVHGAHVQPDSDGYPEAWWLPGAPGTKGIPLTYAERGNVYTEAVTNNTVPGSAFYSYENSQPATTLWYHDHALGMTRLNVYAGPAGFWLIRGGANDTAAKVLPGPAAVAGVNDPNFNATYRSTIREIPIAIQDRSFNLDGSLFYPADRTFFDGFTGPFIGGTGTPAGPSDMSAIWNPEAFFNTMVVNGTTWPKLDVDPVRYRFRLLDGCNSRTLNLSMYEVTGVGKDGVMGTADDTLGAEVPFYQIGGDQGFLPKVVQIMKGSVTILPGGGATGTAVAAAFPQQGLLMGPAERADVIVDFSGMANKRIRIFNTGPDAPFQGFAMLAPADPDTTGQVMDFIVSSNVAATAADPSTPVTSLLLPAEANLATSVTATRQVSLNEMVSDKVCVEINPITGAMTTLTSVPAGPTFAADCLATKPSVTSNIVDLAGPRMALLGTLASGATAGTFVAVPKMWSDPITETPALNSTEIWEIYNTTMDAHPIHLHLVRFEVIERQAVDPITLALVGTAAAAAPTEAGYKDTVIAYPGQVTRIKAKFDIAGLYVWHCHIVEHEDNEMMRSYTVSGLTVSAIATVTASGLYTVGKAIDVTVTFNRPINSTAGLTINLSGGASISTGPLANVTSYTGSYVVAAGQDIAKLDVTSIIGTIEDVLKEGTVPLSSVINPPLPAAGNIFKGAAITIDTIPPALTVDSPLDGLLVNATSLLVSGIATDLNGIQSVTVNGAAVFPDTAGAFSTTITLAAGTANLITIVATDKAGNLTTVNRTVTHSSVLPIVAFTSPTTSFVNNVNLIVSGTATSPVGIKSLLINGVNVPLGNGGSFSTTVTLTANAINSIAVVATDMAGNQKTANLSIQHDDTLPTVNVITPSSAYVNNATQTVSLTATDPVNIQGVTINGVAATLGAGSTYSATVNLTANAANSINIVATDKAGNQTSVTRNVTHSAVLPSVTITSPTAEYVNVLNQTINGTVSASSGLQSVTVNGVAVTTVAGAFSRSMTLTANATNTITVVATDLAGNVTTASRTIIHDNVLPVVTANPPAGLFTGSVVVNLTSEAGATIYYTTDGTTPTTKSNICAGSITLASPATATVILKYYAIDLAGNVGAVTSGSYALHTADLSAKIAINSGATYTKSVNVTLAMSATDKLKVASYAISTDNGATYLPTVKITPVVTYSAKVPVTLPSGDGNKNIYVVFTDGLGAVYPPVIASIILDSSLPVTSITPQPGNYPGGDLNLSLSTVDKSTIYYTINGKTPTTASSKYGGKLTINGVNSTVTVKYFAVDKAGNKEAVKTAVYVFGHLADMTATVAINGGAKYTKSANVTLSFSAVDVVSNGVATMSFSNDGFKFTNPEVYASATAMPWVLDPGDGRKTVYFRFVDSAAIPNTYTYTARIVLATGVTPSTGDLDGDGKVNLKDSLKALLSSAGLVTLTAAEQARGDVGPLVAGKPQPDGVVDSGDAFLISKKAIGLISF